MLPAMNQSVNLHESAMSNLMYDLIVLFQPKLTYASVTSCNTFLARNLVTGVLHAYFAVRDTIVVCLTDCS